MKKFIYSFVVTLLFLGSFSAAAQSGHGVIYADTNNLIVIKVEGTHYERGYAQGELLGSHITDLVQNYIKPAFGSDAIYNYVKGLIAAGNLFTYDSVYVVEAKGVIDGMNSTNTNTLNLDYVDILLANSILDISGIFATKVNVACSSLMSWGDATAGTDLDGKSVVTRHIDWTVLPVLVRNQAMVIHIPSEEDEQPWAQIGFAGMISVLSGFNANIGVFQLMMVDNDDHGLQTEHYEPIWFTLRKAIEQKDPNQDNADNVMDVAYCISRQQEHGYADGYIVSALARSTEENDSLIALVAEVAPAVPYITFRSNAYPDSIPGENLYTANYQIARNNSMHFGFRYNGIKNHIGDGTNISLEFNRDIMKEYSALPHNYQFMTYVPEMDLFRVSVRSDTVTPGYMNPYVDFSISDLFQNFLGVKSIQADNLKLYPNPANGIVHLDIKANSYDVRISDMTGKVVMEKKTSSKNLDIGTLKKGVYLLQVFYDNKMLSSELIKQ